MEPPPDRPFGVDCDVPLKKQVSRFGMLPRTTCVRPCSMATTYVSSIRLRRRFQLTNANMLLNS
jgi:hypothetical protein